ncbi:HAD family hydrolase [Tateyamaria armeniaca]|uniref:HAD family hydrolase n=1 Tax=Tateyamaria armeniaca TaxID=2518930 RepID=A0ABW8UTT4_9RHOB
MTKRIAMWSGPRNLSTAMMYSFAARGDCRVVDEPFYAAFLAGTGDDHPMRDVVLASQPNDPTDVAAELKKPITEPVFYQKHMAHHMLPDWPTDWMDGMCHVLLIRHPARVIASYAKKREAPSLEDLGFVQQANLLARIDAPIVVESSDIRANPAGTLQALCAQIGIPWTPEMLNWPSGGHPQDGAWAPHWYGAVHHSTGFQSAECDLPQLEGDYAQLADAAMPYYEALAALKLKT